MSPGRRVLIAGAQLLLSPRFHLLVAVVAVLVALTGCRTLPEPVRDRVLVAIELTEDLPANVTGQAWCLADGAWCSMKLRRSRYPECATHEVRHLFEGAWHGDTPSAEDCHTY